jgi:hypothetical protein
MVNGKNRTIQNAKPDSLVSMSQVKSSIAGSSSAKRSRTPPWRKSEGRDRRQRDYHLTPYFPIGRPMPRPWGPLSMMYLPCPPWAGWYRPWTLPLMHFHPGWLEPVKGFSHGGYYAGEPGTGKSDALISPKTAATLGQQPGSNRAEERGFG